MNKKINKAIKNAQKSKKIKNSSKFIKNSKKSKKNLKISKLTQQFKKTFIANFQVHQNLSNRISNSHFSHVTNSLLTIYLNRTILDFQQHKKKSKSPLIKISLTYFGVYRTARSKKCEKVNAVAEK